jgi:hypothetical protein
VSRRTTLILSLLTGLAYTAGAIAYGIAKGDNQ